MTTDGVRETRQRFVEQAVESRRMARHALADSVVQTRNGPRTWPSHEGRDVPANIREMANAVIDYSRHVRPKAQQLPDLWEEELYTLDVIDPGQVIEVQPDMYGSIDPATINADEHLTTTSLTVSLDTLDTFDGGIFRQFTYVGEHRHKGEVRETDSYEYHLPPAACRLVFNQVDRCMEQLGWMPEAQATRVEATDSAL